MRHTELRVSNLLPRRLLSFEFFAGHIPFPGGVFCNSHVQQLCGVGDLVLPSLDTYSIRDLELASLVDPMLFVFMALPERPINRAKPEQRLVLVQRLLFLVLVSFESEI